MKNTVVYYLCACLDDRFQNDKRCLRYKYIQEAETMEDLNLSLLELCERNEAQYFINCLIDGWELRTIGYFKLSL